MLFVNLFVDEQRPYEPRDRTKLVLAHEVAHALGAPVSQMGVLIDRYTTQTINLNNNRFNHK